MSVRTESRPAAGSPPPARGYRSGRARPGAGWELRSWLFMRISGIVLLFLAVGHVLIMHVIGGGVGRVNFQFVAVRWSSPFWRGWDWLMLSLALLHGINGLRVVTMDYVKRPAARRATNVFFYALGVVLFGLGSFIVLSFNPARWPGA